MFQSPNEQSPFFEQVCQRLRNDSKMPDKTPVITRQPEETMKFFYGARRWPLKDNRNFSWVRRYAGFRYDMFEITELPLTKNTLGTLHQPMIMTK